MQVRKPISIRSGILILLGFFSYFAMPQFHGIKIFHLFLGLAFLSLLSINPIIRVKRENVTYIVFLFIFIGCAMIGSIRMQSWNGVFSAFLFFVYFCVVSVGYQSGMIRLLLSGLFKGAVFVAIFIILDEICHYVLGLRDPLITYIFPAIFLESQGHQLTNYINIFGVVLYRPSGFAWDPGMTVPGLFLMYVINNEYRLVIIRKKVYDFLILLAIILSVSKTTIIALFVYWLFKLFIFTKNSKMKKRKWLYLLIVIGILLFLTYVGSIINYNGYDGNQKHLKYFWSLRYYFGVDCFSFIFGYGFRNTGVFFNQHVPWLSIYGFEKDAVVESTITNVFLYGGVLGSLYWVYYAYAILNSKNVRCICIFIMMIVLSCGYSIVSCWFYLILNILYYLSKEEANKV